MRELHNTLEDESLKQMDLLTGSVSRVQAVDVTDKVMSQIYQKAERKHSLNAKMRLRPGLAVPAMITFLVLGASVTGYAASQYLEIRNHKGDVILATAQAPEPTEFTTKYTELLAGYVEQVQEQLQPGEFAAYYVKDDIMEQADQANPVKFTYKEAKFTSFGSLQKEIQRTGAPSFNPPSHLPDGYQFDYGYVYPEENLSVELLNNAEYRTLADQLRQEAEAAPAGDKLFIQTLDWDRADFTLARYTKGSGGITISVRNLGAGSRLTVFQNNQDQAEKLSINGTDVFYINSSKATDPVLASNHRLGWLDDKSHLLYQIYDNQESKLTKEELVTIAEELLAAH